MYSLNAVEVRSGADGVRQDARQELAGARLRSRQVEQISGREDDLAHHVERHQRQRSTAANELARAGGIAVEVELGDCTGVARFAPRSAKTDDVAEQGS